MNEIININTIKEQIYTIRNRQVMLDRDLAVLYGTETRVLKQAVKRNIERFPDDFMFQLSDNDIDELVSQSVIPSKSYFGGAIPFAFTEQGVSMLSTVLKSDVAVAININIIRAFAEMRKLIENNASIFNRLSYIEQKQIATDVKLSQTDSKIDTILKALEDKSFTPKQGIFFDGQIFDAYTFVSSLIRSAKHSLVLIDNSVDDSLLTLFTKHGRSINSMGELL